jgi:hypothetical protein
VQQQQEQLVVEQQVQQQQEQLVVEQQVQQQQEQLVVEQQEFEDALMELKLVVKYH